MRSGEDVDLCWRLVEAGARLRYEPIAQVAHDHRTELRDWIARKAFYGGSAAPLSVRHPDKMAPLMISGWALTAWILMAIGSSFGYLASLLVAALTGRRIAKTMRGADTQMLGCAGGSGPRPVVGGAATGVGDLPALLAGRIAGGHRVPATAAASCWSRPSSTGWWTGPAAGDPPTKMPEPIGLLTYLVLKRLDDLAYGLGLWYGVVRERNIGPLKPQIRSLTPDCSGAAQRCADHRCGKRWICCCRTAFG